MQEEEIHNSPEMSNDVWKHSTLKLSKITDSPGFNNADIGCQVRMQKFSY